MHHSTQPPLRLSIGPGIGISTAIAAALAEAKAHAVFSVQPNAAAHASFGSTVAVGAGSGVGGGVPAEAVPYDPLARAPFRPRPSVNNKKQPVTPPALLLEMGILLRSLFFFEDTWPFLAPVNRMETPDYYIVIKHPMDMSSIAQRVADRRYPNVDALAQHIQLVVSNCCQYNVDGSEFSEMANSMLQRFDRLRVIFGPNVLDLEIGRLSSSDVKRLRGVLATLMKHPNADIFCEPVPADFIPGYTEEIAQPMDLGTIAARLKGSGSRGYRLVRDVVAHVVLVWENCRDYNGPRHQLHDQADKLEEHFFETFEQDFANFLNL
jgi:hypothetical protein